MRLKLVLAAAFFTAIAPVQAHEFQVGSIFIDHPWSRPTAASAPVASGYVKLKNMGKESDRLIGIESPIAKSAEVHKSVIEDGVAKMRPQGAVEVGPGDIVDFGAAKLHIMFMGPQRQLKFNDKFPATLVFEKAGRVEVEFVVQQTPGDAQSTDHSVHKQ